MNPAYKKMLRQLELYEEAYKKSPNEYLKGKIDAFLLGMEYKKIDLLSLRRAGTKMPNLDREYVS